MKKKGRGEGPHVTQTLIAVVSLLKKRGMKKRTAQKITHDSGLGPEYTLLQCTARREYPKKKKYPQPDKLQDRMNGGTKKELKENRILTEKNQHRGGKKSSLRGPPIKKSEKRKRKKMKAQERTDCCLSGATRALEEREKHDITPVIRPHPEKERKKKKKKGKSGSTKGGS